MSLLVCCSSEGVFLDDASVTSEASTEVSNTQMEIESNLGGSSTPITGSREDLRDPQDLSTSFTEIALVSPIKTRRSAGSSHRQQPQ